MKGMTPRQRVEATIQGEEPDRVPAVLYFQSAAQYAAIRDDVTWFELLNSASKLSRNVIQQHRVYGADDLFLPLDFRSTSEAFGSRCEYSMRCGKGMRMPVVTSYAVQDLAGIDDLEVPDVRKAGRGPVILSAIRMLSRSCGETVPIIGFLNSPSDVATDMVKGNYSTILPLMMTDRSVLHKLFKKITEYNIEMGKAMMAEGAFALATVSGGFNNLTIGPQEYREFISPYHAKIVKGTGAPYCYHQCQDATPFLDDMVATGCGAISFHELVDLRMVKERYGRKVIIAGNVSVSVGRSTMCYGTPQEVEDAAKQAMAIAGKDTRFWLSAGCEVHHAVPERNIKALTASPKKFNPFQKGGISKG